MLQRSLKRKQKVSIKIVTALKIDRKSIFNLFGTVGKLLSSKGKLFRYIFLPTDGQILTSQNTLLKAPYINYNLKRKPFLKK